MSRREQIRMSDEEVDAFLAESHHVATLGTINPDGMPHLVAMGYVPTRDGLAFLSYRRSQKCVNLFRDPRATVLIESGGHYSELRGVQIRGTASFHESPEFLADLVARLAVRYPEKVDAKVESDTRRSIGSKQGERNRVAFTLEPDRVISWDHRKLGGAY